MSIGLVIAVIVAVALVVGPVTMMRPNPAQKNKENMRTMARKRGAHFSMRNLPRQADEQEQPIAIPVYFLPPEASQLSPSWMLVRTNYEHEINLLGWWAWSGEPRATSAELSVLEAQLLALPESVKAVSSGNGGICVYWEEKGGEPVLQQILALLESLKAAASQR
jgi:hypothetical protein